MLQRKEKGSYQSNSIKDFGEIPRLKPNHLNIQVSHTYQYN